MKSRPNGEAEGFEIARKARDTIQSLDSRFRGNDKKKKAAQEAALFFYFLDARLRGHDNKERFRGNDG